MRSQFIRGCNFLAFFLVAFMACICALETLDSLLDCAELDGLRASFILQASMNEISEMNKEEIISMFDLTGKEALAILTCLRKTKHILHNSTESTGATQFEACSSMVKNRFAASVMVEQDWQRWSGKSETLSLIRISGGLTHRMKVFQRIYEQKQWGLGSGVGSTPAFASKTICILKTLLPQLLGATVLIDIPCGDQQWAPILRELVPNLKYIGVDIVPALVQRNIETYGDARTEFHLLDMADPVVFQSLRKASRLLSDGDTVVVMSRHVFEHSPYSVLFSFLAALRGSGAHYFIGTTQPIPANPPADAEAEAAAADGDGDSLQWDLAHWPRKLNFHLPPLSFPPGLLAWYEGGADDGGMWMEVWPVTALPADTSPGRPPPGASGPGG